MSIKTQFLASLFAFVLGGIALPSIAVANGPNQCLDGAPNGRVDAGEDCDDGNLNNNDGCSSTCVMDDGFKCQVQIPFEALTT